jgi:membrane-associated phospholipid phosphatase
MSQRTLELPGRADADGAATQPQATNDLPIRIVAVAGTVALMAGIAYDMISGRWISAAGLHVAVALALVLVWLPAARRIQHLHLGLIYIFGLFVYTVLRSLADQTAIPIRMEYVIHLDRALFLGTQPTRWLQGHLFDPTRLRPLDWFTVQMHWSYFAVPHVAAALVWVFRRELFPRFVALVLGTFYAGLAIYFLLPTAPPWLAADHGVLPGVSRIMDFVGGQVDPNSYRRLYDAIGVPNPVAAMPSLHMAVTFAVFLFARGINRWLGRVLLVYSILMGFSLVYMGEHYVTDLLVGVLLAYGVHLATLRLLGPRTEPRRVGV